MNVTKETIERLGLTTSQIEELERQVKEEKERYAPSLSYNDSTGKADITFFPTANEMPRNEGRKYDRRFTGKLPGGYGYSKDTITIDGVEYTYRLDVALYVRKVVRDE